MRKQFELTCPAHACASPPSSLPALQRRASCLLSEKMLSGRRRAIKKRLGASLLEAGGRGCHRGEEACSKTHLQYRRCLGVRSKNGHQVINRPEGSAARRSHVAASAHHSAHTTILETFSHLEHSPLLPESLAVCGNFTSVKTKCSCPGRRKKKKKSHSRL